VRNPYVTGAYVVGRKHYGRREMADYLLHGDSRAYWVVGNRRIGKTSLLRQLELLALSENRIVPLFWDMQGGNTFARLGQYLADAVRDAGARFEALGVTETALANEDALGLLAALRRATLRGGRELLLLCDETEVLIAIAGQEPEAMQALHRELTSSSDGLRVVATSTQAIYRLHDACASWSTSPFLAGFDMSQTLGSLSRLSARDLILQTQSDEAVQADPELVEAIYDATNGHPYLIQLLCARLFDEQGRLRPIAEDDLEVDPLLRGFFNNDFNSLSEADRQIVWAVQQAGVFGLEALHASGSQSLAELRQRLHNLERLGYLRRIYGQYAIGNQFLAAWLAIERPALVKAPGAQTSEVAMRAALVHQQAQETSFLVARLNARRARLVELELARARDLLDVSPQQLAEIERIQSEIRHLRSLIAEIEVGAASRD
jgi:hypothetical protein